MKSLYTHLLALFIPMESIEHNSLKNTRRR